MGRDVLPQKEHYTPDYSGPYSNVSRVFQIIRGLSSLYSKYVKLESDWKSREGNPLYLLRVTNFSIPNTMKTKILFSFGEHAREFFPVESMLFFLMDTMNSLRKSSAKKTAALFMLNNVDLFLLPLVNPDGRLYIEKTSNYCWRGTSTGVDLNRNFAWEFGGPGSSALQTDEEYRGPYALSEPEAKFMEDVASRFTFDVFISFHSGIRQIFIPFSDSNSKRSGRRHFNEASELLLGSVIASATRQQFQYNVAHVLNDYPADGTVFDYMAGVKQIPFSLAIEMWGEGDSSDVECFDLFNPPGKDLREALLDVNQIYDAIFRYIVEWKASQHQHSYVSYDAQESDDVPGSRLTWTIHFLCFSFVLLLASIYCQLNQRQQCGTCICLGRRPRIIRLKNLSDTLCII